VALFVMLRAGNAKVNGPLNIWQLCVRELGVTVQFDVSWSALHYLGCTTFIVLRPPDMQHLQEYLSPSM